MGDPPVSTDPLAEMKDMLARVRAARARPMPKLVRIHPLDLPVLKRTSVDAPTTGLDRVLGIPVELDCAVRRGHPEVDY